MTTRKSKDYKLTAVNQLKIKHRKKYVKYSNVPDEV